MLRDSFFWPILLGLSNRVGNKKPSPNAGKGFVFRTKFFELERFVFKDQSGEQEPSASQHADYNRP
jgi:hypothetical protein